MKAAVYYGKKDVRIEERQKPVVAGPNQMVVKIDYVGICGTDIEFYSHGTCPFTNMVLGHENVGTVTEIGEEVDNFAVGDKVICGAPSSCPEMCPPCQRGASNLCINGYTRTPGIGGPDGGYAEYMLVADVPHATIIKVPEGMNLKDAVLFDVICVALHGIRISSFKFGDNVVVSGTGPIGIAAIQCLKAAGANKIIVLGTTSSKFPLLKKFGADYCINSKEVDDVGAEIRKILDSPVGANIAFECAGNMKSLTNLIYKCVEPGAQVMVLGSIQEPMNIIPASFSIFETDIKHSFIYTPSEVKIFLQMANAGKLNYDGMVTDIVSLDDCVSRGLGREDRHGQIKILIDPSL